MSRIPHVTDAERVLLEKLWRRGPLPPPRLICEAQQARGWTASTIKTLIARLIRKGAIRTEQHDGRLRYCAAFAREAYVEAEVAGLIERVFEGDPLELGAWLAGRAPDRPDEPI